MSTTSAGTDATPHCCCASPDCPFLAHNARLLQGLERQVSQAAQLGQALLIRHEEYVADSEHQRKHMMATISRLEKEKLELEANNALSIKTNRDLLDQLEHMNDAVASSDVHIQALTDTLRSTEEELERLGLLAARTQVLEKQLIDLEREQSLLQTNLDTKLADERAAVQRWKTAERNAADLQHQIDRVEQEGREERERHVQVVARMERRAAIDEELNAPSGRPKANPNHDKAGTNVVSHFVKDILLDNANMHNGILELREMLINSNEEVERLRDQLKLHLPLSSSPTENLSAMTLQKELGMEAESVLNQELHIHHHYHGTKSSKTPAKPQAQRRLKKKRFSLAPTHFDPPHSLDRPSTAATLLNQSAITMPNPQRWSQATTLASGSYPTSPVTESHRGSIYDRVFSDVAYDSSRPTSPPDSIDLHSPMFGPVIRTDLAFEPDYPPRHQQKKSHGPKTSAHSALRENSTPIPMITKSSPATAIISAISPANSLSNDVFLLTSSFQPEPQSMIPEENEDFVLPMHQCSALALPEQPGMTNTFVSPLPAARPALRRHASHESLISISGMDIHTLQSRPSQLQYSSASRFAKLGGGGSVGPELTPWTATAQGMLSRNNINSSALNRSLLYSSIASQRTSNKRDDSATSLMGIGIGKKVGGWVFGKWAASPTTETPRLSSPSSQQTQSSQSSAAGAATDLTKKKTEKLRLRPSGVNQSGLIRGFFDVTEVQTKVVVQNYDADALGEALAETGI